MNRYIVTDGALTAVIQADTAKDAIMQAVKAQLETEYRWNAATLTARIA